MAGRWPIRVLASLLLLASSCGDEANGDVAGPFHGTVHRYAIDAIWLPRMPSQAAELGDDLMGTGRVQNALGSVMGMLGEEGGVTTHWSDMIHAGALASSIEIQVDDLANGSVAGVSYFGSDGDAAVAVGGRFRDGRFIPNRTRATHYPGTARALLPVFADADPVTATIDGLEIDLVPDGAAGYIALVRGGVPELEVIPDVAPALLQMLRADPSDHLLLERLIDLDRDGLLTETELSRSAVGYLLYPDATILNGEQVFSVGFEVHLVPCDSGACAASGYVDGCHDRLLDGDETDLDCGGSCSSCPGSSNCRTATDCQTGTCDAGHCAAPTCSDGLRDGFESDIDCGAGCSPCEVGRICIDGYDCASSSCSADVLHGINVGTCMP